MATRDHKPWVYDDFRGDFVRSKGHIGPRNYFRESKNIIFYDREFGVRPGLTAESNALTAATVLRFATYQRTDETTPRYIVLDGSGNFYDTGATVPSTPILTIAAATDFSMVVIANRCYICPFKYASNQAVPISGEKIYVYSGSGTARAAAGTAPSGGTMAAATGAASTKVEAGRYLIAVAFETDTGFITKWGPAAFLQYTSPGGFKISLTNINLGPAGTAARWIGISQPIFAWDGNQANYELFKHVRIADNTTTTATLDFYASELLDSGDYLNDELETIPSGVALSLYSGRLIASGENGDESLSRVSLPGDYESISEVDGFIQWSPGDGGGLKNHLEYGTVLYGFKSQRTYATQDNGLEPANWPKPSIIDGALGAEPHSVATSMDSKGPHKDVVLIGNVNGLYKFNGRFGDRALSSNIDIKWHNISKLALPRMDVVFVPNGVLQNQAHISLSYDLTSAYPQQALLMDFADGLEPELVKWCSLGWTFRQTGDTADKRISLGVNGDGLLLAFGTGLSTSQRIFKLDPTAPGADDIAVGAAATSPVSIVVTLPLVPDKDNTSQRYHEHGITVTFSFGGFTGGGTINSNLTNETGSNVVGPSIIVPTDNANSRVTRIFNVESESTYIQLNSNTNDVKFIVRGIALYIKPTDMEIPG